MVRKFQMTRTAQHALWCNTSGKPHIPTLFYVEGDKKEGYAVSHVNDDLCGFPLVKLRSFYAVKKLVEEINNTGTTDYKPHCATGSFAWANYPMPDQKVN